MVKSGRDTAYPFRLNLGGSMRRRRLRHRSEPLKQGARKSACGMAGHIEEGGAKGKGCAALAACSRQIGRGGTERRRTI